MIEKKRFFLKLDRKRHHFRPKEKIHIYLFKLIVKFDKHEYYVQCGSGCSKKICHTHFIFKGKIILSTFICQDGLKTCQQLWVACKTTIIGSKSLHSLICHNFSR